MTREQNQALLTTHLIAETRHDMDATLTTLHPECVFVDQPLGLRFEGRNGVRDHYTLWWSAFGVELEDGHVYWPDEDDLAIGTANFVGRHVGTFAGIAPTDRRIRLPFVVFVDFRDGLLSGERFVYDLNTLLRQLGEPAFEPTRS